MNELIPSVPAASSAAVKAWFVKLHELTAGRSDGPDAVQRISNAIEQLEVGRYAEGAFTKRSLEHVASKCRFWPAYGEFCAALDGWLIAERQRHVSPGPILTHADGLDAMDHAWLAFYHRRVEELSSATVFKRGSYEADVANVASLVREQSWKAWGVICPTSLIGPKQVTDAEIVAVARALRAPGAPLAGRPMPGDDKASIKPSHASPAELAAMRAARGIKPIGPLA